MPEYLQQLIESEKIQLILQYIYQLNESEIRFLIIITAVLIAVMIFKWFGVRIFFVLLFVYLMIYVIYFNDLSNKFTAREQENTEHMKMIESYMSGEEKRIKNQESRIKN